MNVCLHTNHSENQKITSQKDSPPHEARLISSSTISRLPVNKRILLSLVFLIGNKTNTESSALETWVCERIEMRTGLIHYLNTIGGNKVKAATRVCQFV